MSAEAKRLRDAANGFAGYSVAHHHVGGALIEAAHSAAGYIEVLEAEHGRILRLALDSQRPHGSCSTGACTRCDAEKGLRALAASFISFDDPSEDPSMAASIRRMIEDVNVEPR